MAAAAFVRSRPAGAARRPAAPCKPDARCGDGVVQPSIGECCDDRQHEGWRRLFSAGCKMKGARLRLYPGPDCASARSVTVRQMACSKAANSATTGNTVSGDGCSSDCKTSRLVSNVGWSARRARPSAETARSSKANSATTATPQVAMACSSTCQIEPGADCPTAGQACTMAKCGNGIVRRASCANCGTRSEQSANRMQGRKRPLLWRRQRAAPRPALRSRTAWTARARRRPVPRRAATETSIQVRIATMETWWTSMVVRRSAGSKVGFACPPAPARTPRLARRAQVKCLELPITTVTSSGECRRGRTPGLLLPG